MAFDLADWIASATASVKLAPVTNNKAITDTESEITTDVLFKGLNVTPTRIGFYDGNEWTNFFSSDGQFQVYKDAQNYLKFDGTQIELSSEVSKFYTGGNLTASFNDSNTGLTLYNTSGTALKIYEDWGGRAIDIDSTVFGAGTYGINIDMIKTSAPPPSAYWMYAINTDMANCYSSTGHRVQINKGASFDGNAYGNVGIWATVNTINSYGGYFETQYIGGRGVVGVGNIGGVFASYENTSTTNSIALKISPKADGGTYYTHSLPTWNISGTNTLIGCLQTDKDGKIFQHNGIKWNNIVSNDSSLIQTVKATKYPLNLTKANQFSKAKFHLVLSAADDPTFKLWNASNVQRGSTFSLINAGSTNEVNGFVELEVFDGGILVNCVYSYRKNTTWYHETQNYFIPYIDVTQLSFDIVGSATYTTASYCKITNN